MKITKPISYTEMSMSEFLEGLCILTGSQLIILHTEVWELLSWVFCFPIRLLSPPPQIQVSVHSSSLLSSSVDDSKD